jgi:antiviral helicase SLH1
VDVADFLKVNREAGLFYFDASFRPVPLEQHFIGVKGKAGTKTSRDNIDTTAFEKVREMLEQDHQVMVFVHSRKDTQNTAKMLYEKAIDQVCVDLFDPSGHPQYEAALKEMKSSRGRELRELLPKGIGIHHAGMARSDRNLMEKLFGNGVLKVLCCTATLAWGVNLPAAAVIIKGMLRHNLFAESLALNISSVNMCVLLSELFLLTSLQVRKSTVHRMVNSSIWVFSMCSRSLVVQAGLNFKTPVLA